MKRISRLVVVGLFMGVALVFEGVCVADALEGRKVVVRVFRHHRENEGKLLEKVETVIHGRKIKLEVDDVNESTNFIVRGEDQSDSVVKEFFGEHERLSDRDGLEFRLPVLGSELKGTEVMVRLYKDCLKDPGAFELVGVPVVDGKINFGFGNVGDDAAVALFGSDQKDEMLKLLFGHAGYAWAYEDGATFALPRRASDCN